jgi:hypothetical protein
LAWSSASTVCGFTGRIDEGHLTVVRVHLVGADVLGDAPELLRDDVGASDRVQEQRLAVVDVTHDRDHRRARHQPALVDLLLFDLLLLDPDAWCPSSPATRSLVGQRLRPWPSRPPDSAFDLGGQRACPRRLRRGP